MNEDKNEPLDMTHEPEWDSVEQERDYWKKLAKTQAAKLGAVQATMNKKWEAVVDPQTGIVIVYEEME